MKPNPVCPSCNRPLSDPPRTVHPQDPDGCGADRCDGWTYTEAALYDTDKASKNCKGFGEQHRNEFARLKARAPCFDLIMAMMFATPCPVVWQSMDPKFPIMMRLIEFEFGNFGVAGALKFRFFTMNTAESLALWGAKKI